MYPFSKIFFIVIFSVHSLGSSYEPQLPSIALCCWGCQSQSCRGADQVRMIRLRSECHTSNFILFSRDYQCPFNKMRLTLCSSSVWKLSVSVILTTQKKVVFSALWKQSCFIGWKSWLHGDVCMCLSTCVCVIKGVQRVDLKEEKFYGLNHTTEK